MRRFLICLMLIISISALSQNKIDTIDVIRDAARFYDLNFSDAEADSMIGNLEYQLSLYKSMHARLPDNSIPFPLSFNPLPPGEKISGSQKKINWTLPRTELPKNKNELAFYSISQLAYLIKNKKISSIDLTKFFLDRLKKWSDTLECTITLTEELALKQAALADEEIKKGKYRGPLHGIPYGLKDLFAVKGYKTTWGTTPYKDQMIDQDALVYQKLTEAGAILCAKLSLGSLAYNNKWFGGETKNPWNLKQGSSGSSAGSASATVAGLLPFAIGTETLGSIISPSTRCGATGLRPSFGTISRSGAMVLCWTLDKVGPICRSAEDNAIVYYYIKGYDDIDGASIDHAFNYDPNADVKKLRVGYAENFFKRLSKEAPEHKVLEIYRKMGIDIKPVNFPDSAIYPVNLISIILGAESAAAFDELTRTDRDDLIERQDRDFWPNSFRASRFIPAVEYINANRYRSELCKKMYDFMKDYDVLIVPTYAGRQLSITNLTGNPALCMPIGFSQNGTPQSITLLGRLYDEVSILVAAKAFQSQTDFHLQHPEKFKN